MIQNNGASLRDRASRPSAQARAGLGDSATIPSAERCQRWFRRWDSAPKDGTPFAIPHIYRRNPVAKHWEVLIRDLETGEKSWFPIELDTPPSWWCPLPPLSFELPSPGWFKLTYTVTVVHKSRWAWLCDWIWSRVLPEWMRHAQAIEARSGETGTGSTEGESAVRKDAPTTSGDTP